MCGIFGCYLSRAVLEPAALQSRLLLAQRALHHRGPDDRGLDTFSVPRGVDASVGSLSLGHTRLSIIDLSPAGHQPIHSGDGRFTIVFNGEIYNYRELRAELNSAGYSFRTSTDTEVLLAAWAHWGIAGMGRLTGMFAFAVYDRQDQSLTLVRDAFGIKPLFYSQDDENLSFASEVQALVALLPTKPALNWQRSYDYLVHGDYDSTPDTFYEEVHQLPPGHWLKINFATGKLPHLQRWWQPKVQERPGWRFDDAVEQVREQFLHNIRLHLRSDVPLGAALSGGIDSSAVVCAMRYLEPDMPIHTFSFIAEGGDVNEEFWVDRVNTHIGAIPHKVRVTSQELERDLEDMILSQGEPFGSTSIYAQYRVYQLAREQGITVMLDGQGADEMLAGYSGYPGQRLRSLLETGRLSDAWTFWNNWAKWPGRSRLLAIKYLASEMTNGRLYETLRKIDNKPTVTDWINPGPLLEKGVHLHKPRIRPETQTKGRRVIDELGLSLSKRGISSLLRHGDRNSMRFSIESRVPFLTTNMANLFLSMPEDFLISKQGETKRVFRSAMRGIVPDDVLDRRDKIGFATAEKDLILGMADTIRGWLTNDLNLPFIDQLKMLKEFEQTLVGERIISSQAWRLVNFNRWCSFNGMDS
jgi:asparagine synthase (glutamine-hydrolysing)